MASYDYCFIDIGSSLTLLLLCRCLGKLTAFQEFFNYIFNQFLPILNHIFGCSVLTCSMRTRSSIVHLRETYIHWYFLVYYPVYRCDRNNCSITIKPLKNSDRFMYHTVQIGIQPWQFCCTTSYPVKAQLGIDHFDASKERPWERDIRIPRQKVTDPF